MPSPLPAPVSGIVMIGPGRPAAYTVTAARELTAEIRNHLRIGLEKLTEARECHVWEVLGYPTWHDYCEAEFGDLRELAIPATERRYLVASMKEAAISNRPIADRLGCSPGTVAGDVKYLREQGWDGEPDEVVSSNGSRRAAQVARPAAPVDDLAEQGARSSVEWARALVERRGDRGLTVKELCEETGWHHGQASGALSRLVKREQIAATPARRFGCTAWVALPD